MQVPFENPTGKTVEQMQETANGLVVVVCLH